LYLSIRDFFLLKTVRHNGGVSSQNKTRYVGSHSWRFSAIFELLRWYEFNSPCTKGRAKCSRIRFEGQVRQNFCVRFVDSEMVYE